MLIGMDGPDTSWCLDDAEKAPDEGLFLWAQVLGLCAQRYAGFTQPSRLTEEAEPAGRDHSALMKAMDHINQRWGKGAVAVGSAVQVGAWGMRQERRTGMCTTQLDQVPVAR